MPDIIFSMGGKEETLKLSIFIPSFAGGGAERVMVSLANEFSLLGHEVHLLVANASGPYLSEVSESVHIVDFNKARVAKTIPHLISYLRKTRPTALLSALPHSNIASIIAKYLSLTPTRVVISERNSLVKPGLGTMRVNWGLFLRRIFYARSNSIIAVSNGIKDQLIELCSIPEGKVNYIYNPISITEIQTLMAEPVDHPWITDPSIKVVIAVGRLSQQKDYPTLLQAISLCRREMDVRLLILGEGPLRQELEAYSQALGIHNFIEFMGFEKNPFKWVSRADTYALSSRYEGFPNALIQALACGVPAVSTDCETGPSEILADSRGFLVPVGDARLFSEALLTAMTTAVNTKGRDAFLKDLSPGIIAKKYLDLLIN